MSPPGKASVGSGNNRQQRKVSDTSSGVSPVTRPNSKNKRTNSQSQSRSDSKQDDEGVPLQGSTQKFNCGLCISPLNDIVDESIQCNSCCKWYHIVCCDLQSDDLPTLSKKGVHWYCEKCNGIFGTVRTKLDTIESHIERIMKGNVFQDSVSKALECKLGKMESSYAEVVKGLEATSQKLQSKMGDLDTKCNRSLKSLESTTNTIEKVAKLNEKKEERAMQEFRDKNVIIFGLPDDNGNGETLKLVNDLLHECSSVSVNDDSKCYRLGKKSDSEKPRPVRLCMDSKSKKFDLLKRINSLKKDGIFARRDLSKEEREEDFRLRQELKQKREMNVEKKFMIRKGKIVEVQDRSG